MKRHTFERTDIWREGEWVDLWSIVHFLSGVLLGFCLHILHYGASASVLLALLLLIIYEMWEAMMKIEETPANRFMDVVVGMASFVPTFFLLIPQLSQTTSILVFGVVLVVDGVLSTAGWRASQKASELRQRVHTKFEIERTKLRKQKTRLRKRFRR